MVRTTPEEDVLGASELNALGADGWELVTAFTESNRIHFYFQRFVG